MPTLQELESLSLPDLVGLALSEALIDGAERKGLLYTFRVDGAEFPLHEAAARVFLQRLVARRGGRPEDR